MSERSKIAFACLVGAAIGTITALAVARPFWWLGLVTGFATGYVAYEFRTAVREAPNAARAVWQSRTVVGDFMRHVIFVRAPFLHMGFVFAFALATYMHFKVVHDPNPWFDFIGLPYLFTVFAWLAFRICASVGSGLIERTSWYIPKHSATVILSPQLFFHKSAEFEKRADITYGRALRWTIEGSIALPFYIVGMMLYGCFLITRNFLVAIHSDKRLLCGFDSAIGSGLGWIMLGQHTKTATQFAATVFCGAILGAAFGLLSWELVAKRFAKSASSS